MDLGTNSISDEEQDQRSQYQEDQERDGKQENISKEPSPLFIRLRTQAITDITELMNKTIESMQKLEKSLERVNSSGNGIHSANRIWSSFYDPKVVEKLKSECTD